MDPGFLFGLWWVKSREDERRHRELLAAMQRPSYQAIAPPAPAWREDPSEINEPEVVRIARAALALREEGRYAEALDLWDEVVELAPDQPYPYTERARTKLDLEFAESALVDVDDALRLRPAEVSQVTDLHELRAECLEWMELWDDAIAARDVTVALAPGDPFPLLHRGTTMVFGGRFDEAIVDLSAVIGIVPQVVPAYRFRGLSFMHLGRFEEALDDLDHCVTAQPDDVASRRSRAELLLRLERYDEALQDLDAIPAAEVTGPDEVNRALGLCRSHRYDEGLEAADRAIEAFDPVEPNARMAHQNRAFALKGLGRWGEALAEYDRLLEEDPSLAPICYDRAAVLAEMGRFEEAVIGLRRALELDPARISDVLTTGDFEALRVDPEAWGQVLALKAE